MCQHEITHSRYHKDFIGSLATDEVNHMHLFFILFTKLKVTIPF